MIQKNYAHESSASAAMSIVLHEYIFPQYYYPNCVIISIKQNATTYILYIDIALIDIK